MAKAHADMQVNSAQNVSRAIFSCCAGRMTSYLAVPGVSNTSLGLRVVISNVISMLRGDLEEVTCTDKAV